MSLIKRRSLRFSFPGIYTAIADNGRGLPAEATVTFAIDQPLETPAAIAETDSEIFMSLGAPARLHCMAYGYPKPTVTWLVASCYYESPSFHSKFVLLEGAI